MTYYISGPMTGLPDLNRPAFTAAGRSLNLRGHNVISPFDLSTKGHDYRALLARDIAYLVAWADALYMLSGWERSPGARAEHAVAEALELIITYEGDV